MEQHLEPDALRRAFGAFPSGVVAVCALDDAGGPRGMLVSTFIPVSLEPPLVALSLRTASRTWPLLRERRALGLSVLSADHQQAAAQLAARDGDRFAGLELAASASGALHLVGAPVGLECTVDREIEAGDHLLVILSVAEVIAGAGDHEPLVFHRSRLVTTAPLRDLDRARA